MNKLLAKHTSDLARATIFGAVLILSGCGTHAASGSGPSTDGGAVAVQVIRDPDNRAWIGAATAVDRGAAVSVIRDADNPYWNSTLLGAIGRGGGSVGSQGLR